MLRSCSSRHDRAKYSIAWYFFLVGAVLGNWAALIPAVQRNHDINNAVLGGIMGGVVLGAILVIPIVTYCVQIYGSRVSTRIGCFLLIVLFPLLGYNGSLPLLVTGMVLYGFCVGFQDISMNGQAILHEKALKKPSMGFYTAMFAVGALSGALSGGLLLGPLGRSTFETTYIFSLVMAIPSVLFSFSLYSLQEEQFITESAPILNGVDDRGHQHATLNEEEAPLVATISDSENFLVSHPENGNSSEAVDMKMATTGVDRRTLFITASLCFVAYFGEGAVSDWSAIYLTDHGASPLYSTFGMVLFQLFLAIGRYYSDTVVVHLGKRRLLRISGLVTALGLTIVSVASFCSNFHVFLWISICGFSLCGTGLAVVYPTVISIAGSNIRGMPPATAIAYVSSVGYLGVMIGPPSLGGLSFLMGMRITFGVVAAMMLTLSILPHFLK